MIIEIDPETGNVLRSINVNDLFDKTYVTRSDWAHINAFAYIPEEDCVIVSMRNIHTIAKISLKDNELIWIIANPRFYKKTEQKDKVLKPAGHIDWFSSSMQYQYWNVTVQHILTKLYYLTITRLTEDP